MRRLPAFLLLLGLLLPTALAQVPTAPAPCGPLVAVAASPTNAVAPGSRAEVIVTVYNNGTRPADVVVSVAPATAGWTVTNPEDQTAPLAAGSSQGFTFTVSPGRDATGDLEVGFQVEGTCALPAPGVPCPPNACTTAAAPTSALVRLDRPGGGGIPGLGGLDFPLEYLVAGVVLVGVAAAIPLLLRKRSKGFSAECPEPLKMVRPGRGISFPVEVRNPGAQPVTAHLEIGPIPEGWTAFMPLPEVQLAPGETRSLWLMVRAPPTAAQGQAADVELRLRQATRPEVASVVRVRAEVDPNASEGAGGA